MWETLRTPKAFGKERRHCSFCATALGEIATVQKIVAKPPCSLSAWDWENLVRRTLCSTLGLVAIAM
jgi:hypothetical protein